MHIKVKQGLDIPIKGKPDGEVRQLEKRPKKIALNLDPFEETRFHLLAKEGDRVQIGQPLAEDKLTEGQVFVSPATGALTEIRRGLKRRLLDLVIDVDSKETHYELEPLDVNSSSPTAIMKKFKAGGIFSIIRCRPFNRLAHPEKLPRSIFVKALESAPLVPPPELQIAGHESDFQTGLDALAKLTEGPVHLVYRQGTSCRTFTEASNVQKHTATGPHPVGNFSVHIQALDPIRTPEDIIWTLTAHDVVAIGHLLTTGRHLVDRVISIAGPGIKPERVGYYQAREGFPIADLAADALTKGPMRLISGDPLTGLKVEEGDFLHCNHYALCAIPESVGREFLSFLRLGLKQFSFSRTFPSGIFRQRDTSYDFTTSLNGEPRAFVDGTLYDKVMPLNVPTMPLVKAVIARDFDLAEELGLLEVDSEDFALPTFVCPSKMEMTEIIHQGLKKHATDLLG